MAINNLAFICQICFLIVTGATQKNMPPKQQSLILSDIVRSDVEGSTLQVNCTARLPSPSVTLRWIPPDPRREAFIQTARYDNTLVMTIPALSRLDAGHYTCMLFSENGSEETAEFRLLVKSKETTSPCSITQFKCKRSKFCIFMRYRCDGRDDCGDGSDEDCGGDPCMDKFRCNNTRCVSYDVLCDHIDNCGDLSDESAVCLQKSTSTVTSPPVTEDSQFGWMKITVSTVIASTVGVVILISFIVIMVFRIKMKRLRELRIARAFERIYQHDGSREPTSPGHGEEGPSDQHPFLPSTSQPHYGNIIVNVNNGVQYMPGYDYSLFMDSPPPYTEGNTDGTEPKPPPPPYSTLDRRTSHNPEAVGPTCNTHVSQSSVQNYLGIRNADGMASVRRGNSAVNNDTSNPDNETSNTSQERPSAQAEINTGTLPNININSRFLQSLLGSHLQVSGTGTNCSRFMQEDGAERSVNQTSHNPVTCQMSSMPRLGSSAPNIEPVSSHSLPSHHCTRTNVNNSQLIGNLETNVDSSLANPITSVDTASHEESLRLTVVNINDPSNDNQSALNSGNPTTEVSNSSLTSSAARGQDLISPDDDYDDPWDSSLPLLATASAIMPPFSEVNIDGGAFMSEDCFQDGVSPNEDGTFLVRKHKDRWGPKVDLNKDINDTSDSLPVSCANINNSDASTTAVSHTNTNNSDAGSLPVPSANINNSDAVSLPVPCANRNSSDASNALFVEISKRDEERKPKPGHLSVERGQILLHTDHGVLASDFSPSISLNSSLSNTPTKSSNLPQPSRLSGELVVKDGAIMLQMPSASRGQGHSLYNPDRTSSHGSKLSLSSVHSDSSASHLKSSDPPNTAPMSSTNPSSPLLAHTLNNEASVDSGSCHGGDSKSQERLSGELSIKDGCLVLEAPKHTPSSQILSHLQGVYAAEQRPDKGGDEDMLEPVVNTKRPAGTVVSRPPLPKFNSDIVLPFKNQHL
ncbi:uncharacterized protein LOC131946962 [Physella acuta]|uniref:uncharacterized protein LOC131946962 n=1 Tax=Physella acuta TaxID=109671 RepID=UPI0027DCBC16|nr:uncharacterized protein LOC131946962 [Physella acuta]